MQLGAVISWVWILEVQNPPEWCGKDSFVDNLIPRNCSLEEILNNLVEGQQLGLRKGMKRLWSLLWLSHNTEMIENRVDGLKSCKEFTTKFRLKDELLIKVHIVHICAF
jgi:hypothetical protein